MLALHTPDLGGDGNITEAERAILRRAATLIVELEKIEVSFALGNDAGYLIDRYQRCANTLSRLLETLGLQRRARDVTPTLSEYLASKAEAAE